MESAAKRHESASANNYLKFQIAVAVQNPHFDRDSVGIIAPPGGQSIVQPAMLLTGALELMRHAGIVQNVRRGKYHLNPSPPQP
jgi:hypothetical protein